MCDDGTDPMESLLAAVEAAAATNGKDKSTPSESQNPRTTDDDNKNSKSNSPQRPTGHDQRRDDHKQYKTTPRAPTNSPKSLSASDEISVSVPASHDQQTPQKPKISTVTPRISVPSTSSSQQIPSVPRINLPPPPPLPPPIPSPPPMPPALPISLPPISIPTQLQKLPKRLPMPSMHMPLPTPGRTQQVPASSSRPIVTTVATSSVGLSTGSSDRKKSTNGNIGNRIVMTPPRSKIISIVDNTRLVDPVTTKNSNLSTPKLTHSKPSYQQHVIQTTPRHVPIPSPALSKPMLTSKAIASASTPVPVIGKHSTPARVTVTKNTTQPANLNLNDSNDNSAPAPAPTTPIRPQQRRQPRSTHTQTPTTALELVTPTSVRTNTQTPKKGARVFSAREKVVLEANYKKNKFPTRGQMNTLAIALGKTLEKVRTWFNNRRALDRKLGHDVIRNTPIPVTPATPSSASTPRVFPSITLSVDENDVVGQMREHLRQEEEQMKNEDLDVILPDDIDFDLTTVSPGPTPTSTRRRQRRGGASVATTITPRSVGISTWQQQQESQPQEPQLHLQQVLYPPEHPSRVTAEATTKRQVSSPSPVLHHPPLYSSTPLPIITPNKTRDNEERDEPGTVRRELNFGQHWQQQGHPHSYSSAIPVSSNVVVGVKRRSTEIEESGDHVDRGRHGTERKGRLRRRLSNEDEDESRRRAGVDTDVKESREGGDDDDDLPIAMMGKTRKTPGKFDSQIQKSEQQAAARDHVDNEREREREREKGYGVIRRLPR